MISNFNPNIFKVDQGSAIISCGEVNISSLPTLVSGSYFTSSNGVNPLTAADLINNTQVPIVKTIFIYGLSGFPAGKCQFDQNSFTVTINPVPTTNPVLLVDRTFCDEFDNVNDGLFNRS